jgi:hypothetical protein
MYKLHHKHQRSSKTMVEDLKKGQSEVNALYQNKGCYSEAEDYHQTLKIIGLKRPHETWKSFRLRRS